MLIGDVIAAIEQGSFGVFAVGTLDESLVVLTGLAIGGRGPTGEYLPETLNGRIERRLCEFVEVGRALAREALAPRGSAK